jgi:hypothetical protein
MLTRICHRVPNLNDETLTTIKALQEALTFKKLLCSLFPVVPAGFIHVPAMLDAFGDPSLPMKVRQLQKLIGEILLKENIDWAPLIDFIPTEEWTTPKKCFTTVVTEAIAKGLLINSPVLEHIEKLLQMVYRFGNVKVTLTDRLVIDPTTAPTTHVDTEDATIMPSNTTSKQETKLSISPDTTRPISVHQLTSPATPTIVNYTTPRPVHLVETSTLLIGVTYPTPPRGTHFPQFSVNIFYVPASIDQREQLLPSTAPFIAEHVLLKPIRDFIVRPDLLDIFGPHF